MAARARLKIPVDTNDTTLHLGERNVALTNLNKIFFTETGTTKRDLLQYYADVAPLLLPHLRERAMVMKRYPGGAAEPFFFMKRTPPGAPAWLTRCSISHGSGNIIDFPIVDDVAALLWVINLGCIDLNQWYAKCDDVDRPDYVHFDLDPVKDDAGGTPFEIVRESALVLKAALDDLGMPSFAKTSGSRGIHIYIPIVRGPVQKDCWTFAKAFAFTIARSRPDILTAEYRIAKRPAGRILVDYNQNAWGRTLASIYSVRPTQRATVSTPVEWEEIAKGFSIDDFRLDNVRARFARLGDLWKPLVQKSKRVDLAHFVQRSSTKS